MQSLFNITAIDCDYSNKKVIIKTTFTVDKTTVTKKNIQVVEALSGTTVIYKLSVIDDEIIIQFKDSPSLSTEYQINIKDIKDMLKRDLRYPITKNVMFKADTQLKAVITVPANNEAVIKQHNLVYFAIKQIDESNKETIKENPMLNESITSSEAVLEDESEITYDFEFSADAAFFNVVKQYSSEYTNGLIELPGDQYYMRARVVQKDMHGDWSDTITFTVVPDTTEDIDNVLTDSEKEYLDDIFAPVDFFLNDEEELEIVSYSDNGYTYEEFYLEFNHDLDESKLPKQISAYRSDL